MTTASIQQVRLYGSLAEEFGDILPIKGDTPARIMQIIEANFPGRFLKALCEGSYFVWSEDGAEPREGAAFTGHSTPETLMMGTSRDTLHIMPEVAGSSRGKGGIMAIIGVAMIGVAIIASGGTLAAPLASFSAMQGTIWGTVATMGLGLVLSGVGMMLSPMPELATDDTDQEQSYILSGAVNVMNEGRAIPVLYGEVIVGSTVVSAGIDIEQMSVDRADETSGTLDMFASE